MKSALADFIEISAVQMQGFYLLAVFLSRKNPTRVNWRNEMNKEEKGAVPVPLLLLGGKILGLEKIS